MEDEHAYVVLKQHRLVREWHFEEGSWGVEAVVKTVIEGTWFDCR